MPKISATWGTAWFTPETTESTGAEALSVAQEGSDKKLRFGFDAEEDDDA